MTKHKITAARYEDGERIEDTYEYRGFEFRVDKSVGVTYYGRYQTGGYRKGHSTAYRSEMIKYLDEKAEK